MSSVKVQSARGPTRRSPRQLAIKPSSITPAFAIAIALGYFLGAMFALTGDVSTGVLVAGVTTLIGLCVNQDFAITCIAVILPMSGALKTESYGTADRVICGAGALSILFHMFVLKKRPIRIWKSPLLPLAGIAILGTASYVWANDIYRQRAVAQTLIQMLVWGIAVWNALMYDRRFFVVLRAYVGAALGVITYLLATGALNQARFNRVSFGVTREINPADFAVMVGLGVLAAAYLLVRDPYQWCRPIWLVALTVFPITMIFTGSRGPLAGLVAAIGCSFGTMLLSRTGSRTLGVTVVLVVTLLGAGYWALQGSFADSRAISRIADAAQRADALKYRMFLMSRGIDAIAERPFFGAGVGNARSAIQADLNVHVDLLFLGTELGIPAMLLFSWFVWRCIRPVSKLPWVYERWFAQTAIVFLLVAGCAHVLFYRKVYWFFMILCAALAHCSLAETREASQRARMNRKARLA